METDESLEDLEVYFTIEQEHFGEKVIEDLVEDGAEIKVTQDNKQEYCQLYADFLLNKSIKKQFDAFKRGFYKVV
jgi:ubiquitin-protein ligase E3 A